MEMEAFDKAGERVFNAPPEEARQEFGRFCQRVVDAVDIGDLSIEDGAYRICGTAARVLDALQADERNLMTIAGNLELPEEQRDQTLPDWAGLKRRIAEHFPIE